VQSVERALRLLFKIADHPEAKYGLSELSEFLDIDKSSVFRLLSTLIESGLVRQNEGKKGYQLGYGIYSLAAALREQLKITDLVSPFLKKLALSTQENAHLALRSGSKVIFIDRERATKTIAANTNIGDSEELYCTAIGKCLICDLGETRLRELLSGMELIKYTDKTITDIDELAAEIQRVSDQGYALDNEEYEAHVICLAAPLYNFEGHVEAAIGISGPRDRLEAALDFFIAEVKRTGSEISALLGGARRGA
jgi:DNA-binding IclR family transcriptional regulator